MAAMKTQTNEKVSKQAMQCHCAAMLALLLFPVFSLSFLHVLPPLLFWLSHRAKHPLIDAHGREACNFTISVTFYLLAIAIIPLFVLTWLGSIFDLQAWLQTTFHLSPVLFGGKATSAIFVLFAPFGAISLTILITATILTFKAAALARRGMIYRYPFTIRSME